MALTYKFKECDLTYLTNDLRFDEKYGTRTASGCIKSNPLYGEVWTGSGPNTASLVCVICLRCDLAVMGTGKSQMTEFIYRDLS